MNFRRLFGLDLCGKIRSCKRRYRNDVRLFDYTSIICVITKWNGGSLTVGASAFCQDPGGFSMDQVLWFYQSPYFYSIKEAELHLAQEVGHAAKSFPSSSFFFAINDHRYIWKKGEWVLTDKVQTLGRCSACGFKMEEVICPKCGEHIF